MSGRSAFILGTIPIVAAALLCAAIVCLRPKSTDVPTPGGGAAETPVYRSPEGPVAARPGLVRPSPAPRPPAPASPGIGTGSSAGVPRIGGELDGLQYLEFIEQFGGRPDLDAAALRLILAAPLDGWDPCYGYPCQLMTMANRAARREEGR